MSQGARGETAAVGAYREHEIDWRAAVDDVVWIPAAYRSATVPLAAARKTLRCTEASFAQLVDLGLPHEEGPDGPRFDPVDLKNVGLYSRSQATEVELAMRLMLSFMGASREELTQARRWRYRLRLLSGAEAGARVIRRVYRPLPEAFGGRLESCEASVGPAPEVTGPYLRMAQGAEVVGTLTTRGVEQVVRSGAVRQVFADLVDSGIRWHALPEAFAADPWLPASLGAGNCGTLCAVLEQRLAEAGFEARSYHGWMLTLSEVDHGWVDVVDEDGKAKCLDPSFALLATRNGFGSVDFRELVVGSILNRVVPTAAPLASAYVVDGGDDVVSFTSRPYTAPPIAALRARRARMLRRRSPR